ncbi:vWA domain-containing protein [Corynebacterium striatum]|uniref:vWA domain-containing protein n=1 Tax=Corynebacterium striatum TaxID=43770 RepID=UPI000D75752E|nr:VWA domain-containing protein [Corynebacterium striatum]PXY05809.1 magnesium chelatase [Corynebacterium striatum]
MFRSLKVLLAMLSTMALTACSAGGLFDDLDMPGSGSSFSGGLNIVAATELKPLEPVLDDASQDLGFDITMTTEDGTLANSRSLKQGGFDGTYDATWFATNRYARIIGADEKLRKEHSVARSPVVLGVQPSVAKEKGWTTKQPTWQEIADSGITFGMTDPSTSNSGFSALAAVTTAFADTGRALTEKDIRQATGKVQTLFSNQTLTSGSSGWLADRFREHPEQADAILNYESVLYQLKDEGVDLEVVIPSDGVISADYPLSALASSPDQEAEGKVQALAEWFAEHPEKLRNYHLRVDDSDMPGTIFELPYPANEQTVSALEDAFAHELRNPGNTALVLDTSGSMEGERIDLLKNSLRPLIDGSADGSPDGEGQVAFRNREQIKLIPYSSEPQQPTRARVDLENPATTKELADRVDRLVADGDTATFEAVLNAFNEVDTSNGEIGTVVLMTDGEVTRGRTFAQFKEAYEQLPPEKKEIPVFVILYGEANIQEMEELAQLTGGKTFDALNGDLAAAFEEIRAYQ